MRPLILMTAIVLAMSSTALGQDYDLTIHLEDGGTITIALDDIRRIEFANILTGVLDPDGPASVPGTFQLLGNYPNPFNPATTIEYEIPSATLVSVRIYDLHGALVRELVRETQAAGRHQVMWDGTDGQRSRVASGVYIYAVACGDAVQAKQLILVK